jgi:acetyl-CoA acetyltransferase
VTAVISGAGQSRIGRRLGRSALDLVVEAAQAAIVDAGLTRDDIDGLSTYPGLQMWPPGFSDVGAQEVMTALGLRLSWFSGGSEAAAQIGSVITAAHAVEAGAARHVLCFRVVTAGSRRRQADLPAPTHVSGVQQWTHTYGRSPANWIGALAQRHFHEYGTTREQLGAIALTDRRHAGLNPAAIYRDPLSMDDYLSSRMISTPLTVLDCDVPVDGATAFIVSIGDAGADLRRPGVVIEAVGSAIHSAFSYDQFPDLQHLPAHDAARAMWSGTDASPADVDVACVYDGMSWLAMIWLEALGFCGPGESGAYVEGGARIALDGELPFNPHGGQLSAGRLHGYGFLHEAYVQLRGEGGERQVAGDPQLAVVSTGGGPFAGCMLLRSA